MAKIKYIGLKEAGETAFAELTGIARWFPGDVHDLPEAQAGQLLEHRMMWERTDKGVSLAAAAPKAPAKAIAAGTVDDQDVDDEATKAEQARKTAATGTGTTETDTKPEGTAVIKVGEGWKVLDAMEAPDLHALAKELGVKVHHAAGAAKVIDALVASQAPAKKAKK